jgi:hypothetical protein
MQWKLFNRNSASMHPSPHIKRASKLILNKRKPEKTLNLPSWIFKNSNHLHDLRRNAKGQLTISYMLAKLFAQKVDSNLREMKNKCLILACINISGSKNNWNLFLLRKNI